MEATPQPKPRLRRDVRIVVSGFACLLVLFCFARDLDMSCFGIVALPALLLTVLVMGLSSGLLAIYHAVRAAFGPADYWRAIRLEGMHLVFLGAFVLLHNCRAIQRVPDCVFVWSHLDGLEAAVEQCMKGAVGAAGGVRYSEQVAFHFIGNFSSFTVHDPRGAGALSGEEMEGSYWQAFPLARDRARHVFGPWWMVTY